MVYSLQKTETKKNIPDETFSNFAVKTGYQMQPLWVLANASMGAASVCSNTCSLHCVRQYYRNIF